MLIERDGSSGSSSGRRLRLRVSESVIRHRREPLLDAIRLPRSGPRHRDPYQVLPGAPSPNFSSEGVGRGARGRGQPRLNQWVVLARGRLQHRPRRAGAQGVASSLPRRKLAPDPLTWSGRKSSVQERHDGAGLPLQGVSDNLLYPPRGRTPFPSSNFTSEG